jgi:hypothetical protein
MRRNRRTLEKIQQAFADAVAAGQFEKAEGWLAVARWAQANTPPVIQAAAPAR